MVVLLEGSPISTEELCQRDHQVLGHLPELWSSVSDHQVIGQLPDQGPSPPIAQFGQAASSKKSVGGSKLPFKNGGHCSWGPSMLQKC